MKYCVSYNNENKKTPTYTMDNFEHFKTLKEARSFIQSCINNHLIGYQYVITKITKKGITRVYA